METTSFESKKFSARLKNLGQKIKQKGQDAADWVRLHPEETQAALIIGISALGVAVDAKRKAQKRIPDTEKRVWDPVMGFYWELRRPMSNNEKRYFNHAVAAGCARGSVLEKMHLLK